MVARERGESVTNPENGVSTRKDFVWEWTPGSSVGPIRLGENIGRHFELLGLTEMEAAINDDQDKWVTYESDAYGVRILTCNDVIESVSCDRELLYRGLNLLGLQPEDALGALSPHTHVEEPYPFGWSFSYDELGLELYVVDGVVTTASIFEGPGQD